MFYWVSRSFVKRLSCTHYQFFSKYANKNTSLSPHTWATSYTFNSFHSLDGTEPVWSCHPWVISLLGLLVSRGEFQCHSVLFLFSNSNLFHMIKETQPWWKCCCNVFLCPPSVLISHDGESLPHRVMVCLCIPSDMLSYNNLGLYPWQPLTYFRVEASCPS